MKNFSPRLQHALHAIGALILAALAYKLLVFALFKPVRFALACAPGVPVTECERVRADYSYDGMDGQFAVYRLYLKSGTVDYGNTTCWVKPEGSACMGSSDNQNRTGNERLIVPLDQDYYDWRWSK